MLQLTTDALYAADSRQLSTISAEEGERMLASRRRADSSKWHVHRKVAALLYRQVSWRPKFAIKGLYADTAWNIMLDLYINEMNGKSVSVTSACIASRVPPTTALRHIGTLCNNDLIVRIDDTCDRRRSCILLTGNCYKQISSFIDKFTIEMDYICKSIRMHGDNSLLDESSNIRNLHKGHTSIFPWGNTGHNSNDRTINDKTGYQEENRRLRFLLIEAMLENASLKQQMVVPDFR